MSIQNPYLKSSVNTAPREHFVVMLYDGMLRFINIATNAIRDRNHEVASNNLKYAQDIVLNLRESLDKSISPDLFENLYPLYDFWYRKLVEANIKKSVEVIEEILPMIQQLRDAWQEAERQLAAQKGVSQP